MGEDNTGARKHVKIDNTPDFDKNSQTKMLYLLLNRFEQPELKTWGIFYFEKDKDSVNLLVNTLK